MGHELCVMLKIAVSSSPRSTEEVISHEMLLLIDDSIDPLVKTLLALKCSHVEAGPPALLLFCSIL